MTVLFVQKVRSYTPPAKSQNSASGSTYSAPNIGPSSSGHNAYSTSQGNTGLPRNTGSTGSQTGPGYSRPQGTTMRKLVELPGNTGNTWSESGPIGSNKRVIHTCLPALHNPYMPLVHSRSAPFPSSSSHLQSASYASLKPAIANPPCILTLTPLVETTTDRRL